MRKKAILRTLAYADVFDYPLKENEIFRFLISNFQKELPTLSSEVSKKEGFYCAATSERSEVYFLKGRKRIVVTRKKRERWSREKLKIAKRVAGWLKLIPTIQMVAVTGALAMNNSEKEDDIDLLIVTSKKRLWLTRLLTVFLVELVSHRRRPQDKNVKDKICLNMFLDEKHLAVPKKEQDLFSAHEACQLKLLWDRNETYQKFVKENQWVKRYLPNWKP